MVSRVGLIAGVTAFAESVDGLETPARDLDVVNAVASKPTPLKI